MRVVLVDLSAVVHPIFHMSAADQERDPNHVSTATVAKVRSLIEGFDRAAVCCDSGRSFRHDADPEYKANRGEPNEVLKHQARLAQEILEKDGLTVWSCKGYEADDIIATAVNGLSVHEGVTQIVIASSDKDLMQLVEDGVDTGCAVLARSIQTGVLYDEAMVYQKFGVSPRQMADYLALVGDASDNVKGIKGIGAVGAAKLLNEFGDAETMFQQIEQGVGKALELKPAMYQKLKEGFDTFVKAKSLVCLAMDAPINVEDALVKRESAAVAEFVGDDMTFDKTKPEVEDAEVMPHAEPVAVESEVVEPAAQGWASPAPVGMLHISEPVKIGGGAMVPVGDFKYELEPRNQTQAIELSKHMHNSRLFAGYGTPQAVLSTVMAGRELGLGAMASLRGFHVIEGRPALSSGLIMALVLKSGKAKFFACTERSAEKATFTTQRDGDPHPMSLSYTIEEAQSAGYVKPGSGWVKNPADMLVARASSKLARLVYPDVVFGLYDPDEIRDSMGVQ